MGLTMTTNKLYTGNRVAKDLLTPKYRMRVVPAHKQYDRAKAKRDWRSW